MRHFHLFLVLLSGALIGCSGGNKSGSGGGGGGSPIVIPEDVSINEKTLPEISDEQFVRSKNFALHLNSVTGLEDHIFPAEEQSWQERQRRERRYERMTDEQKVLAKNLKDNCKFEQSSASQGGEDGVKSGTVVTSQSKIQNTRTDICAVDLLREMNSRIQVHSLNQETRSANFTMEGTYHMHTEYIKPEHIQATQVRIADLGVAFSGNTSIVSEEVTAYSRLSGGGTAEFIADGLGNMDIKIDGETLSKKNVTNSVITMEFRDSNQSHSFAFHAVQEDGKKRIAKAFIGDRQLTPQEIVDLKIDDFAESLTAPTARQ